MSIDSGGNLLLEHTIRVQLPNAQYDFTIKGAFRSDDEMILLGYHSMNEEMTMLGVNLIKSMDSLTAYLFGTYQQTEKYYEKALKLKVDKKLDIYSDISSGFWMPVEAGKLDLADAIEFIESFDGYKEIEKTSGGFLFW